MADEEEVPRRFARRQARVEAMRAGAPQRVRVNPRDDEIRKVLKHPASGAFRSEGSTEWQLDQFTKRRLRDGSITLASPEPEPESEPEPQKRESRKPVQQQAAAAKPSDTPV